MNRKQFIEKLGATCSNWNWSWSFINHESKSVIFGAWDEFDDRDRQTILHEEWRIRGGRKAPGYTQAIEHLSFVGNGYALFTFPMERSLAHPDSGKDTSKIKSFVDEVQQRRLEKVGPRWLAVEGDFKNDNILTVEDPNDPMLEGKRKSTKSYSYERNPIARAECLARKGFNCVVCQMSFLGTFGQVAANYIHVHHVSPVALQGGEYEIDPLEDLIPVCPNCHAVMHMRKPDPFSVDEVRSMIEAAK